MIFRKSKSQQIRPEMVLEPEPIVLTPEEMVELGRLKHDYEESVVGQRVAWFKTMSPAAREEVIKNEELREFYHQVKYGSYPKASRRLQDLADKAMFARYHLGADTLTVNDVRDYINTLPPSIRIPLETLRRAHLDALADDMIDHKL